MTHLFLNKDLSLLAREKGFDELCFGWYDPSGNLHTNKYSYPENKELTPLTAAPLYQQIIDWFREKNNYHIQIRFGYGEYKSWYYEVYHTEDPAIGMYSHPYVFDSYYEALTIAIEKALNLLL